VRKPRRDELWDRTPGGVIVPRRPTLPTRRFIQKWGTAKCCCGGGGFCNYCTGFSETSDVVVTLAGTVTFKWWIFGELHTCVYTLDGVYTLPLTGSIGIYNDEFAIASDTADGWCLQGNLLVYVQFICGPDTYGINTQATFRAGTGASERVQEIWFKDEFSYSGSGSGDCMAKFWNAQGDPFTCGNIIYETADAFLQSGTWGTFTVSSS
jgi:hypothetical protein